MKKYKKKICMIAAIALLGMAAFCCYHIFHHYAQESKELETFEGLAVLIEQVSETEDEGLELSGNEEEHSPYTELFQQNPDMVGWIQIDGTTINYPVMQTPEQPNYYLKRNFYKQYSALGVPYVQEDCDLATSDNLIIYGHHINGGKMFGALESYKSKSFYEKHKVIQFDTLTGHGKYEIIAVFKTVAYSASGFRYYDFVDAESTEDFDSYFSKCKELALYETGLTAEYGDRLLTLSTCEYSQANGRLVVVAKKID